LVSSTFCDETNKFDFGLKGGIGLQVLFFGLDFSYTYGLSDVAKEEAVKINNRAWSLALIVGVG
ncbi:MAG: PorT family protein, partial [Gemmatimonadetes bacterium]|nr:PorT family protein [Gemmatimonadota bacterium]